MNTRWITHDTISHLNIPLFYCIQIVECLIKRNILVHTDSQGPTTTTSCEGHSLKINLGYARNV